MSILPAVLSLAAIDAINPVSITGAICLGMPVDRSYADRSPFAFTGTVKKVVFDINPHLTEADEQELHEHAHHGQNQSNRMMMMGLSVRTLAAGCSSVSRSID